MSSTCQVPDSGNHQASVKASTASMVRNEGVAVTTSSTTMGVLMTSPCSRCRPRTGRLLGVGSIDNNTSRPNSLTTICSRSLRRDPGMLHSAERDGSASTTARTRRAPSPRSVKATS